MNRVNVSLHVIPSGVEPYDLESYDVIRHGKIKSTSREIKVNKVVDGYSIVYEGDVFQNLQADVFVANIVKIFQTNVPNTIIDTRIYYHFNLDDGTDAFEMAVADKIMKTQTAMIKSKSQWFRYNPTMSVGETLDYMELEDEDDNDNDDDEDDYDDGAYSLKSLFGFDEEDEEDDDDDDEDPFGSINDILKGRMKSSRRPRYESYGRSKVLKNANNPKRAYHRHGLIIANNKDDIRRDEKILKEFLKEFIPGNSDWKKDFRRDVLKRWMKMYAISKKNLKELEKDYRRSRVQNRSNINTEKALDFTRRLFNVPVDSWSDPNR